MGRKAEASKKELKNWAKSLITPTSKIKEVQAALESHQLIMEDTEVSQDLLQKEENLQKDLQRACRVEEECWRQKSRSMWLQAGDKNTSYYHKQDEAHKHFKTVNEIHYQGTLVKDFEGIKRVAHSFKDLFSAPKENPIDVNSYPLDLIPKLVHDADNLLLTAPISIEELKKTLDGMEADKAPGPDGLTARFFSTCWPIIKVDLLRMVRKSQSCSKLGGSTNSAFLALIPKEKRANNFSKFRPISLCNTGYKLVTKIIANRLKNILPAIIPENQGAFIKGRKILDNIVLVEEAIHSSCQWKEKGMVIKLDLANAFNRVRHDFLFAVMGKFGFSKDFINWVKACISSP